MIGKEAFYMVDPCALFLYPKLHTVTSYPPETVEVMGTLVTQVTAYSILALVFAPLNYDLSLLGNYKLRSTSQRIDLNLHGRFFVSALRNQLIAAILHVLYLIALRQIGLPTPICRVTAQIPPFAEVLIDILLCTFGREILYHYLHRMLHHPRVYPYFHRHHHQFNSPVALAGLYFHPVDYILTGVLPIMLPAWVIRVHILTMWLNTILVFTEASVVHCRYDFYGILDLKPKSHDLHHKHKTVNSGVMGIMDYLHGTKFLEKSEAST
jgi:sterol desaturase/sphingolipid hydroxylase (fatty acid hydroxylase superfamily)